MSIAFLPPRVADRRPHGAVLRMRSLPTRFIVLGLAATTALVAVAQPAFGQSGNGFLFGAPNGSFTVRGGYALANAGSGVFEDAISQLTIDKRDFSGFSWGGDISYSPNPKFDIVFDGEVSSASHDSEFREFEDNFGLPIEQTTKFRRVPLTVGLRYYLADRGREVSRFAYIPNRYAPYVGLAAGAMYYRFKQEGDFIDFDTPDDEIFLAKIEDSGWTPMAHGMAGVDYSLGPWFALTLEGRYQWAKARLDPDVFEGYDRLDLTGFTGTVGFKVRF